MRAAISGQESGAHWSMALPDSTIVNAGRLSLPVSLPGNSPVIPASPQRDRRRGRLPGPKERARPSPNGNSHQSAI